MFILIVQMIVRDFKPSQKNGEGGGEVSECNLHVIKVEYVRNNLHI